MPRQFPPRPPHLPSLSCGYQTSACADLSNGTASVPVVRQTDTGKRPRDEGGDEDEETVPDPDDPFVKRLEALKKRDVEEPSSVEVWRAMTTNLTLHQRVFAACSS